MATPRDSSILLEVVVPLVLVEGEWAVEAQAWNGIARWMDNFDRVTLCCMVIRTPGADPTARSLAPLLEGGRLTIVPLPYGCWSPKAHYAQVGAVRRLFRSLIPQHRYLCFANLGWWGAWGTVACSEARRAGRPYSVWLDYVLHDMPRHTVNNPVRQLARDLIALVANASSLGAVRRSSLGLFHGRSVYEGYRKHCRNPQVVHDIHLKKEDGITREALELRLARPGNHLRLGYLGRVHAMKGPQEWLRTMALVAQGLPSGTEAQATWLGEGPLLDEVRLASAGAGSGLEIRFPGNVADRDKVLEFLREQDLFVFCHLTPESPRNLIEALMSGVPIVGFDSPYARDLVEGHGGGVLVPLGDVEALAAQILRLVSDRPAREQLAREAWAAGQEFDDESVFRHRSDLIKQFLP